MANDAGYKSHRTIKSLVLDYVHRTSGNVDYEALTAEVKRTFPDSAWKKTHWAWYKSQIINARFRNMFTDAEREALRGGDTTGTTARAAGGRRNPCREGSRPHWCDTRTRYPKAPSPGRDRPSPRSAR